VIAVRIVREGAFVREAVFHDLPVSVGRTAESDVVLFDPSVSRAHARIEQGDGGEIVLRDLGSRNGLHLGPSRVASTVVPGLLRVWVGRVEIEIEILSEADTREFAIRDWDGLDKRRTLADQFRYLVLGAGAWLLTLVVDPSFWSPWNKARVVTLMGNAIGIVVALPLFSFGLLVALKAAGRRVRMADTLQALARVLWLLPIAVVVSMVAYYLLPGPGYALLDQLVGGALLVGGAVHVVSVRRAGPSRRFRTIWASAIAMLYLGLQATGSVAGRRTGAPAVDYHVQPPLGTVTGPSEPLDRYFERLQAAATEAAASAETVRVRQAD
jgi:hypothetical protein